MAYRGEPYDASYFFNSVAYSNYEEIEPEYWVNIADDIEAQLGPVTGIRTLEIGCAFGFLTNELANRGADIEAVDYSAYAIAEAQSRFPALSFIEVDAVLGLPFSVNEFRLVVTVGVTDCMTDEATLDTLLNEANRVLHPQGNAYILGSSSPVGPYFVKTPEDWNQKVIGGRTVVATDVGNILPWDVRILVS